jgi:hypothetical protein
LPHTDSMPSFIAFAEFAVLSARRAEPKRWVSWPVWPGRHFGFCFAPI